MFTYIILYIIYNIQIDMHIIVGIVFSWDDYIIHCYDSRDALENSSVLFAEKHEMGQHFPDLMIRSV